MNNKLNETLYSVAEEVFESLAFVLPAFEEEKSAPPEGADMTMANISFAGPFQGTLCVSVSDGLLPMISTNMLGLDFSEILPEDVHRDALKEVVNVICGNLLPELAGEQAVFDVDAAKLLADGALPATIGGHPPLAAAQLHLEDGWAELVLFAPQSVAAAAESPA